MAERPLVLLSNDDGYDAAGLLALREQLSLFADVIVCAPTVNQSASSHALTLHSVLRLVRYDDTTFAVDGTPADCVYVALHSERRILPRRPDMVVSGMNHGPNLGVDVVYSGTVAAAREGAQRGIPAVAVSASSRADRGPAAKLAALVVERAWQRICDKPPSVTPLLNINIPSGDDWAIEATRLGRRLYLDDVIYRQDPRDHEYMWIGGSNVRHERTAGTDTDAWEAGRASLTPLSLELWNPGHAELTKSVASVLRH